MLRGGAVFPPTRWSLILTARVDAERRRIALGELLAVYWKPLYVFARSLGLDRTEAEDIVQHLCADLLANDTLAVLDPARGRLRSFLRTALVHRIANWRAASRAARRGGGVVPMDIADVEPVTPGDDPERAFERAWARAVLGRAMAALRAEYESGARSGPFSIVERFFGDAAPTYSEACQETGMTISQLKSFLHRARTRYRELVGMAVADTLDSPADLDAEIAAVMRALAAD